MSAAEAVTTAGPFSPSTLSVFSQLLAGYNLSAASETFEEQAAAIGLARRELADAIVAAGMVPGAGPNAAPALKADVELAAGDELPGLKLVEDEAPPANRQARRAAAKPAKASSAKKVRPSPAKRG